MCLIHIHILYLYKKGGGGGGGGSFIFFFNDTATTEIYTLSLHDALPISGNFEKSSVTFEECLAMRKRLKGEDCNDTSIALVLYNLANNYVDLKQFEIGRAHV